MQLLNLTSQQLRDIETYAEYFSKNRKDLTIIVDSNKLTSFNLLSIYSGNISSNCHTTYHHYDLVTKTPKKFESTYLLHTIENLGKKLTIYHMGTGFFTDGSGVPATLPWGGDGIATTTDFTPVESTGQQLSCNCINPSQLGEDLAKQGWALTAPAESMAAPYLTGDPAYNCGTGSSAEKAKTETASAPCLSCFELNATDHIPSWGGNPPSNSLKVIVGDACPYKNNPNICPSIPGTKNKQGTCCGDKINAYNHFDLWLNNPVEESITSSYPEWTKLSKDWYNGLGNWPVTFKPIPCNNTVYKIMLKYKCTTCT